MSIRIKFIIITINFCSKLLVLILKGKIWSQPGKFCEKNQGRHET